MDTLPDTDSAQPSNKTTGETEARTQQRPSRFDRPTRPDMQARPGRQRMRPLRVFLPVETIMALREKAAREKITENEIILDLLKREGYVVPEAPEMKPK
ncbi:MAG: hypothetical protein RL369_301 [Pseudomonadota bacterium]